MSSNVDARVHGMPEDCEHVPVKSTAMARRIGISRAERSYSDWGSVQSTPIWNQLLKVTHYLGNFLLQEDRQIERTAETESMPAHTRWIRQDHVGEALE